MSLFKTKEFWSTENSTQELFSPYSLLVAQFKGLLDSPTDIVIVGSLGGTVRIFNPLGERLDSSSTAPRPETLILETNMGKPIIQIAKGRLHGSDAGPHLAILHPRVLSVYSLEKKKSKTQGLENYQLNLLYQHNMQRQAFCMTVGPFGKVSKRDFICVESIDGTLSIYEQETFSFSRFLPDFLLPGPVVYTKRTDSFVTISSSHQLESFRFETLAVAKETKGRESDTISVGKRVTADWVLGLGEAATHLEILEVEGVSKDVPFKIVVLGTRTLFVLLDTGILVFSKKLDYSPLDLLTFSLDNPKEKVISLVATETQTLLLYDHTTLKWASQLPFQPLAMRLGSFQGETGVLQKMLTIMSKKGDVQVVYLGTDPTLFTAPPDTRIVNYDETDKELTNLSKAIKAIQSSDSSSDDKSLNPREDLEVNVEVSGYLERCYHQTLVSDPDGVPMARIIITLRTSLPLTRVRMSIDVASPICVTHSSITVNSLTDQHVSEVYCYLYEKSIPHSLDVTITSVFFNSHGVPSVLTNTTQLPLRLVVKPCSPIKDADYKITISTNKPAVSLLDLFPELVLDSTLANATGFQFYGGPYVTVLSSKTSQRYRLQSDNLPSLWVLVESLERRLRKRFAIRKGVNGGVPLEVSYSSSLPLHEYFSEIDAHFAKKSKFKALMSQLGERAAQFRSIERRLLTRFKDKTPTPLTNLDTLMEATYRQVLEATDMVEQCQMELSATASNLACITNLLLFLVRLMTGMSMEEANKVKSALSPVVTMAMEQGWEEVTDAALTFLLRTSLAKAGKENQGATPITLEPAKDTIRVRKHISSVMDRIVKGGRIHDYKNPVEGTELIDFSRTGPSDDIEDEPGNPWNDSTTPVGSHFGESGDRIRSAKIRGKTTTINKPFDQNCHDDDTPRPDDSNLMKEREVYNDDDTDIRDEDLMANGDGGGSGSGSGDDDDAEGW